MQFVHIDLAVNYLILNLPQVPWTLDLKLKFLNLQNIL